VGGGARKFDVVLDENVVVENGDTRGLQQFAAGIEARAVEDDVVPLPLAGWTRGIDERGVLAVNGARLAVGVGFVFVGIEDLNFVGVHQVDAAVAAFLALTARRRGFHKFDVKLAIAEGVLRVNVVSVGDDFGVAVFDFPIGGGAVFGDPFVESLAIEKDDGVGRRFAGRFLRAGGSRSDDGRKWAAFVVDLEFGIGLGVAHGRAEQRKCDCREKFLH